MASTYNLNSLRVPLVPIDNNGKTRFHILMGKINVDSKYKLALR